MESNLQSHHSFSLNSNLNEDRVFPFLRGGSFPRIRILRGLTLKVEGILHSEAKRAETSQGLSGTPVSLDSGI